MCIYIYQNFHEVEKGGITACGGDSFVFVLFAFALPGKGRELQSEALREGRHDTDNNK